MPASSASRRTSNARRSIAAAWRPSGSPSLESRRARVILYLHGGSFAFRFPNAHAALAARLCRHLGARALIPDYRLAPEHPYPRGDDCHRAYRALIAQGLGAKSMFCSATRRAATSRW